ncbi:MAG: tyrosine-type recombinase/integrase [Hominilimicola sp.]
MGKDLKGRELGTGISQLKDGRYKARYTNRYGRRMPPIYSRNLKEVKEQLLKAKYEDSLGRTDIAHKNLTLGEVYKLWIREKEDSLRPNTVSSYIGTYNKHIKQYEFYNINAIDENIVREFVLDLYKGNSTVSSLKQCKMIFSSIMKYAVEKKYCFRNPFSYYKIPKKILDEGRRQEKKRRETKYMTEQQRDYFIMFLNTHKRMYSDLYKFLMFTGMRISEGIALKWNSIDMDNRLISIESGYTKYYDYKDGKTHQEYDSPTKTIASERKIPINNIVYDILLVQKDFRKNQPSEFVFTDRQNRPLKYINVHNSLENLIKRINITLQNENADSQMMFPKVTTHYFRHTFATMCLEKNIHPRIVQQYLGHSSYATTMNTYSHVSNDKGQIEMSKFDYTL